jgi:L-asparagine transporter-like permease
MKVSFITIALLLFALLGLAFFQNESWFIYVIIAIAVALGISFIIACVAMVKNIQSKDY